MVDHRVLAGSSLTSTFRKPSTAGEITELVNRDLDLEDRPFLAEDVEEWLRSTDDTAVALYRSRARPRK